MINRILALLGLQRITKIPGPSANELDAISIYQFNSQAEFERVRRATYELIYSLENCNIRSVEYPVNLIRNVGLQAVIDENPEIDMDQFSALVQGMTKRSNKQLTQLTERNIKRLTGMDMIQYMQYLKLSENFNRSNSSDESIN